MKLVYNIDIELAAIAYMVIICCFLKYQYSDQSELNRRFRIMAYLSLLVNVLDVVTAITISYGAVVPYWLNIILNTVYIFASALLGNYFMKYVAAYAGHGVQESLLYRMVNAVSVMYYVLLIVNIFQGYVFSFNEAGMYIHGPVYLLIYAMPLIFSAAALCILLAKRKYFEKKQVVFILFFISLSILGPLLQVLFIPDVLVSVYTVTLAVVVMLFALETPDYQKLLKTMEELEKIKEEAEEAKKDALAANLAKSKFMANMSHELRTPINAIMGMNEMIIRECQEENIKEYAYNIQSASQNLLSLINDTLDYSKIEAGKMKIVEANYQVSSLLNNVVSMTQIKAEQKRLEFEVMVDPNLPKELCGDEMRMRQVMINILNNAVKYTRVGNVYLTIHGKQKSENEILLRIKVTDTGIGIREEDRKKLFHDFERLDMKKNRNVEGTGLGLAITKKLVEQMNGKIEVQSVYGEGSTFTVHVPQKIVNADAIGDFREQHKKFLQGQESYHESFFAPDARILVVDDNKMNLMVVQGLLKKTRIQIDTAEDGRECLSKLIYQHYDVILLDHMMPEMDGIETLGHAKALEQNLSMDSPYIVMTANVLGNMREFYLEKGFDDYLSKPIEGAFLEKMLMKYIPEEKINPALVEESTVTID